MLWSNQVFRDFYDHTDMEEDKVLGKRVEYPDTYCPEILVNVPRSLNREIYDL